MSERLSTTSEILSDTGFRSFFSSFFPNLRDLRKCTKHPDFIDFLIATWISLPETSRQFWGTLTPPSIPIEALSSLPDSLNNSTPFLLDPSHQSPPTSLLPMNRIYTLYEKRRRSIVSPSPDDMISFSSPPRVRPLSTTARNDEAEEDREEAEEIAQPTRGTREATSGLSVCQWNGWSNPFPSLSVETQPIPFRPAVEQSLQGDRFMYYSIEMLRRYLNHTINVDGDEPQIGLSVDEIRWNRMCSGGNRSTPVSDPDWHRPIVPSKRDWCNLTHLTADPSSEESESTESSLTESPPSRPSSLTWENYSPPRSSSDPSKDGWNGGVWSRWFKSEPQEPVGRIPGWALSHELDNEKDDETLDYRWSGRLPCLPHLEIEESRFLSLQKFSADQLRRFRPVGGVEINFGKRSKVGFYTVEADALARERMGDQALSIDEMRWFGMYRMHNRYGRFVPPPKRPPCEEASVCCTFDSEKSTRGLAIGDVEKEGEKEEVEDVKDEEEVVVPNADSLPSHLPVIISSSTYLSLSEAEMEEAGAWDQNREKRKLLEWADSLTTTTISSWDANPADPWSFPSTQLRRSIVFFPEKQLPPDSDKAASILRWIKSLVVSKSSFFSERDLQEKVEECCSLDDDEIDSVLEPLPDWIRLRMVDMEHDGFLKLLDCLVRNSRWLEKLRCRIESIVMPLIISFQFEDELDRMLGEWRGQKIFTSELDNCCKVLRNEDDSSDDDSW